MTGPSVTVVIPTHGRPQYLAEALGSVLAQTAPPLEVVVVSDDGDPATAQVVTEVAACAVVPVRLLHNTEHPGASGSRNLGAGAARGQWLAMLDDDDLWEPGVLADSLAALAAEPADFAVSWLTLFRGQLQAPGQQMPAGLRPADVVGVNPGFIGSNFVIRTEAYHAIGGFDVALLVVNDRDFLYRALAAGHRYTVSAGARVLQRKHEAGQLTTKSERRARGLEQYLDKHRDALRWRDRRAMRMAIHRMRYHVATTRAAKLRYFLAGVLNASPGAFVARIRDRRQRIIWHGPSGS